MGKWDGDDQVLADWQKQEHSPAAPKGMQQAAHAAGGQQRGEARWQNSTLASWQREQGYIGTSNSWYTGQNREGVGNGWNTDFYDRFMKGQKEAQDKGNLADYYAQKDATGVVLYDHKVDHTDERGRVIERDLKFGDIIDNGEYKGNVYTTFDKPTANLMMSDLLLNKEQKAHIFDNRDRTELLDKEIDDIHQSNNRDWKEFLKANAFGDKIEHRSDVFQEGAGDEAVTAAGGVGGSILAAGGAAAAASAAGGSLTGPGAALFAVGGFAVGAGTAWLNRDKLNDTAARAFEVTALATKENGLAHGIFTGVQEWSGAAGNYISPLSNLTQGAGDIQAGRLGDGEAGFYKVDAKGDRKVSKFLRVADVGATIGDSLLQFASPIGVGLYSAQMTGTIVGETGGLVVSGGKSFDDRRGDFDNIFTDEKGNFDLVGGAAGIGKVGIDAVQLGMVRGLAGKTDSMRALAGESEVYGGRLAVLRGIPGVNRFARASEEQGARGIIGKLPKQLGGWTPVEGRAGAEVAADTLKAGGKEVEYGGFRHIVDASGHSVTRRPLMSLLAPSEQLSSVMAGRMARRKALNEGRAVSADDYYAASRALAVGEQRWKTTVVNAMGEAYEEGLQAVLEPRSHNAQQSGWAIFEQAAYGAAAGAGMGFGMSYHAPGINAKMKQVARLNRTIRQGGFTQTDEEWDREWAAMSPEEQAREAQQTPSESEISQAAYRQIANDQAATQVGGTAAINKYLDAAQAAKARDLRTATDRTDGAFVIIPLEEAPKLDDNGNLLPGEQPSDAVGASLRQTVINLANMHRGVSIQLQAMQRDLKKITEDGLPADPENPDLLERQASLAAAIPKTELVLQWGQRYDALIDRVLNRVYDENGEVIGTEAEVRANTAEFNELLRQAYNMEVSNLRLEDGTVVDLSTEDQRALARAVSMVVARDPHDQAGSFQMLLPQANHKLTAEGIFGDNILQVSNAILPAIRGDFDGDKMRPQNQLILDDTEFVSARSGSHFLGAGSSVNVGTPTFEKWVVSYLGEALRDSKSALSSVAAWTEGNIARAVRERYADLGINDEIDEVLTDFFTDIRRGNTSARETLINGLASKAGGRITDYARANLSNEWLWLDMVVRANLDSFQEQYAAHRPQIGELPDTTKTTPHAQQAEVRVRLLERAATFGQSLGLMTPGDTMFRKFQKLHYTVINAPVLDAEGKTEAPMQVEEMAMLYEALSSQITSSELDNIRSKDGITGRVFAMLQHLAEDYQADNPDFSKFQAMVVVANLKVRDIYNDDGSLMENGGDISLAQLLLKREVQRDMRAKALIADTSDELQAKWTRLLSMTTPGSRYSSSTNAERAFVEVFAAQQFYTLLGQEAAPFGPHLTVEQWIRQYVASGEIDRRDKAQSLHQELAYLGREGTHDMPYDLTEIQGDGKVSAFRSVVDAVLAVGNTQLTINPKLAGRTNLSEHHLSGEKAERHYEISQQFQEGMNAARAALRKAFKLSPRDGELEEEQVARLFRNYPEFARGVLELIPNVAANAVLYPTETGEVEVSSWVYKMFTFADAAEAEMHFHRNLILAQWKAMDGNSMLTEEEADPDQHARQYSRITRRHHQMIYRLGKTTQGKMLLKQFVDKMESSTSPEEWLRWVNTHPGIRAENEAPYTLWVDDVAEFDPDRTNGGWSSVLPGAELRESVRVLRQSIDRLVDDLNDEQMAADADVDTLLAIQRVIDRDSGKPDRSVPGDQELYDKLQATIDLAADTVVGLGPQALLYQVVGAARGFYPQAHTKGTNPDYVELDGQFEAQRDAWDFVTNYERMLSSLTSVNLDAVNSNLGQVAKDGVRTMDDFGNIVAHDKPTVEQMVTMLRNADTRPMARAILYPQVMERTSYGTLSPQMLVGKSLKELIEGSTIRDLIAVDGSLSHDSALRYASLLEAESRKHGGNMDFQRAINDMVIAKTSAADHTLSTAEIQDIAVEAIRAAVLTVQKASAIVARPHKPGTDPLEEIRDNIRKAQKLARNARALNLTGEDQVLTDVMLDQFVEERKREQIESIDRLRQAAKASKDSFEITELKAQQAKATADYEAFLKRVDLLRDDNIVASVVEMFRIPKPPAKGRAAKKHVAADVAHKKQKLLLFVRDNYDILERASSGLLILNKITRQKADTERNGQVDLADEEWTELSNMVIALYLDKAASLTGAGVSVPPFPDADHPNDERYYDTTFSYVTDPFLTAESSLIKAGVVLHNRADLHADPTVPDDVYRIVDQQIFKDFSFGDWTSDIPRASIEANQRLDSSAAAPAIAMAGNSPKRQAVISAATKRTFLVPTDEMLANVTVTMRQLASADFDEILVTHPDQRQSMMPLAMLNNRFASQVVVTLPGVDPIDLLASDPVLGQTWYGNEDVAGSKFQTIHRDRILQAVGKYAKSQDMAPADAVVQVSFFHPDDQPETTDKENWYNNVFFEGTSFKLDADRHDSLNSTLWFAEGSLNPVVQAGALDASKKGLPALKVIEVEAAAERERMEAGFATDFAGMLRQKTERLLTKDLGTGALDIEFYNALYKDLKLRHYVRSIDAEGTVTMLTAEQVIAMQNRGEALPDNATLWIPTDDVLRSMLGEMGNQGVARVFPEQLEINLAKVPAYRGFSDTMKQRFAEGLKNTEVTPLALTRVANRSRQGQLAVRTQIPESAKVAYDAKMQYFEDLKEDIHGDRADEAFKKSFKTKKNLANVYVQGKKWLEAENIAFDWSKLGIRFIGPRKPQDTEFSKLLLHDLAQVMEAKGLMTGWIYREGGKQDLNKGLLNQVNLTKQRGGGMRVAPGDLVLVELDSFGGDTDLAEKRLTWLASQGATVILASGESGRTDIRGDIVPKLKELNYEKVAGSVHVYKPAEYSSRYQNQKARESSLTEMRGVSTRNRVANFLVKDKRIEENGAWVNGKNRRLNSIGVTMDLVPVDFLRGFGVPTPGQIDVVKQHLAGMATIEGRAFLRELSKFKTDAEAEEFDAAFTRMLDRFDKNPGTVLPVAGDQFGTGDLLPLIDARGKVLLYRHGYKAPQYDTVQRQLSRTMPGEVDGQNVAVFSSQREPAATVHTGEVVRFKPRSGYGLSVEMQIPLSVFGDKKQLEWNGMKYLLTPMPDDIELPDHGFFDGWGIDMIASIHDTLSKEATADMVNNHRNAFAYFGIDFLPDVTEFFFPGTRGTPEAAAAQAKTLEVLRAVAGSWELQLPLAAADELIHAKQTAQAYLEKLPTFSQAQAEALGVDTSWTARLDEESVEAQIARTMILYLSTPGARVSDVLRSGGFNNDSTDTSKQSVLMPRLFTQYFDRASEGSKLRTEINRRFNAQLNNPHKGTGTGYRLHQDWTFEIRNDNPAKNMEGFLQFAEAHSSGDNPIKNGMAFDEHEKGAVSYHSAAIAYLAIGAETAYKYDLATTRNWATDTNRFQPVPDDQRDITDGGVWRMLTDIPGVDNSFKPWRPQTPAEAQRRGDNRKAMVLFRTEFDKTGDKWRDGQDAQYYEIATKIVEKLHLNAKQVGIVDGWVRQMLGRADAVSDDQPLVSGDEAIGAARDIWWNVERNYSPTLAAMVPGIHVNDWQMIYRANKDRTDKWAPKFSMDAKSAKATDWKSWTDVAFGSTLLTDELFDPLFLHAVDGFMNTYQNATRDLGDLPVSYSALISAQLIDPETSRLMAALHDAELSGNADEIEIAQAAIQSHPSRMLASIDPNADFLAANPVVLDSQGATFDDLVGGKRIAGRYKKKYPISSELAKRRQQIRQWREETDMPLPVDVTMKDFRQNGARFRDEGTRTNSIIRGLIDLRVTLALLNPALVVSMGPEQWIRATLDKAANLLTGQSTSGPAARLLAKTDLSRFTPDQLRKLNILYSDMGERSDFKRMVYTDLHRLMPGAEIPGHGRLRRLLTAGAKAGQMIQDPTYGVTADTLARRYMEGVMRSVDRVPTLNVLTTDQLVAEMATNPEFVEKRAPELHAMGINSIAQIRSLKNTMANAAWKGFVNPLAESRHYGVNLFGNLLLKIPSLFSNYAFNVGTTLLGLQGFDEVAAMFLDARDKGPNSLLGRAQQAMRGKPAEIGSDEKFDFSTVISGLDLADAFIRGGLTHTALFSLGLMAGGLGLSGEDDEAKRRRRAREMQGTPYAYDPRQLEHDIRNADSIYLNWLPFGWENYFKVDEEGNNVAELHWMTKQFISPLIGMERFFSNGDPREITWGFQDALGSFPIINTMMWGDAVETGNELAAMANDKQKLGGPENLIEAGNLLTRMVAGYERMMAESSTINMIYQGMDPWDRDPYAETRHNADGSIRTDMLGEPEAAEVLKPYVGKDGVIHQGYVSRSNSDARLHALTENRVTAAAVLSLLGGITGAGDDFWRGQMPVKTREIEKPPLTNQEVKTLVLTAWQGTGGLANISTEEALGYLRANLPESQKYTTNEELLPLAKRLAREKGRALLGETEAGFKGLDDPKLADMAIAFMTQGKGHVDIGDVAASGLYMTKEQRDQIAEQWTKDIVQQGMHMGLDETRAIKRMKRLWNGEFNTNQVGIGEILYDTKISYSDKVEYAQLNTSYVIGPDGLPKATGWTRDGFLGALGLKPLKRAYLPKDTDQLGRHGAEGIDARLNTTDFINNINTGMRALVIKPDAHIPDEKEIAKSIIDAIEKAAKAEYTPFSPYTNDSGGSGYGRFGRYGGYGGYGGGYGGFGGGGGGGSGYANFEKMYALPSGKPPYGDSIPFINTTNPIIRRESVRRERVWSERGKLKPWQ